MRHIQIHIGSPECKSVNSRRRERKKIRDFVYRGLFHKKEQFVIWPPAPGCVHRLLTSTPQQRSNGTM